MDKQALRNLFSVAENTYKAAVEAERAASFAKSDARMAHDAAKVTVTSAWNVQDALGVALANAKD